MTIHAAISVVDFREDLADALVRVWRDSFEAAVGITDPYSLEEKREYLFAEVVPKNTVRVVLCAGAVVGFIAASKEAISQLYLSERVQRQGIGTMLVEWAKAQSEGKLALFTFARNAAAQRFYERNGFTMVARGFAPEYELDDLRYEWVAQRPGAI